MPSSPDSFAPDDSAEEYVQQIESLSRLLAESALAEVARHVWADLKAVKSIRYEPGSYQILQPPSHDPKPLVTLVWTAGRISLSEAFQMTEENTLTLTLPSVRFPVEWEVPPPEPGQIPPVPEPLRPHLMTGYRQEQWEQARDAHQQAWEAHLGTLLMAAEMSMDNALSDTQTDEEELAYAGMKAIQARRRDPQTEPGETILKGLQGLAATMRGEEPSSSDLEPEPTVQN